MLAIARFKSLLPQTVKRSRAVDTARVLMAVHITLVPVDSLKKMTNADTLLKTMSSSGKKLRAPLAASESRRGAVTLKNEAQLVLARHICTKKREKPTASQE